MRMILIRLRSVRGGRGQPRIGATRDCRGAEEEIQTMTMEICRDRASEQEVAATGVFFDAFMVLVNCDRSSFFESL